MTSQHDASFEAPDNLPDGAVLSSNTSIETSSAARTAENSPSDPPSVHADGRWMSNQKLHDLRNEAQAIRLGIMLLGKNDLDADDKDATAMEMHASLERLLSLIADDPVESDEKC